MLPVGESQPSLALVQRNDPGPSRRQTAQAPCFVVLNSVRTFFHCDGAEKSNARCWLSSSPQSDEGIDSAGTARRQIARDHGYNQKDQRSASDAERVAAAHSIQKTR
jgi:hypothetical protein